jgi:hypothetical protein
LQTSELTHKLIKKIKDERFDEESIHQYAFLVNVGTRDLQVGVVDPTDNRMLFLEDYVFPAVQSHTDLIGAIDTLFEAHPFIRAGFWKSVKFSFKNQHFVQVPSALFAEDSLEDYLKFNSSVNSKIEKFNTVSSTLANAVTVFAVHKDLDNWITSTYPNLKPQYVHQSAVLIDGVMRHAANRSDNPLYVYVDRFKLHLLSVHEGKLIYYNQFIIKQFADYVKYIMLVMKSLQMDQQTSQVVLWGYIGNNSPHYQEFYKYIKNVSFGKRPAGLQFAYFFDEVQEHHYFDLYNIHFCG